MRDYEYGILSGLAEEIQKEPVVAGGTMPGDRWLLSSAMQKAIRRGEDERVLWAASSLWHLDKQSFWRRLHVIALEDIGIGDVDVLIKVLFATSSPAWRSKVDDLQVGLYLVRLLCGAVKSRLADAVFIQAEKARAYDGLRARLAKASDRVLADHVVDEDKLLMERAIAAWLLAGTKKYPSDFMLSRPGSVFKATAAIQTLHAPAPLIEACIKAIPMTPWPLSLFMPLIWQEVQKHKRDIHHEAIRIADSADGLPLYAADMFTRVGKACFQQLRQDAPALREFTIQQIGLAVFYTEGAKTDRTLTSPGLDAIQQAGEITDIESAGLPISEYERLREHLYRNRELLDSIREKRLLHHLFSLGKQKAGGAI